MSPKLNPAEDFVTGNSNDWILFRGTPEEVVKWLKDHTIEPYMMVYVGEFGNYALPELYFQLRGGSQK